MHQKFLLEMLRVDPVQWGHLPTAEVSALKQSLGLFALLWRRQVVSAYGLGLPMHSVHPMAFAIFGHLEGKLLLSVSYLAPLHSQRSNSRGSSLHPILSGVWKGLSLHRQQGLDSWLGTNTFETEFR